MISIDIDFFTSFDGKLSHKILKPFRHSPKHFENLNTDRHNEIRVYSYWAMRTTSATEPPIQIVRVDEGLAIALQKSIRIMCTSYPVAALANHEHLEKMLRILHGKKRCLRR